MTLVPSPPEYGQQVVQVLAGEGVLAGSHYLVVHATSETVSAEKGEGMDALVHRLVRDFHVQPVDLVRIHYKAGAPQYAVIERGAASSTRGGAAGKR